MVGVITVDVSSKVRDRRVILDEHQNFSGHINTICKKASIAINNIGYLRRYLSRLDSERLAHAVIMIHLDYRNSLLFELPSYQIEKLQRIQNTAAHLVTGAERVEHISHVLRELHWLPADDRIAFKFLLITFKILQTLQSFKSALKTFLFRNRYSSR